MESNEQTREEEAIEVMELAVEALHKVTRERKELQEELQLLRADARIFATRVLEGDNYGCHLGPHDCLHGVAKRFLDNVSE